MAACNCSGASPITIGNTTYDKFYTVDVCRNICTNSAECGVFAIGGGARANNTYECFSCEAAAPLCSILESPAKGCTPSGDCVVCDATPPDVIEAVQAKHRTDVTVLLSTTCHHYRESATATFTGNLDLEASATVRVPGPGVFAGNLSIAAPHATLDHFSAHRVTVTGGAVDATRLTLTDTLVIQDAQGPFTVARVASSGAFAVAFSNCRGTAAVADTVRGNAACAIVQDALAGPPLKFTTPSACTIVNLTSMVGTFGDAYEIAFLDGGMYGAPPTRQLAEVTAALVGAAIGLAFMLPLAHPSLVNVASAWLKKRPVVG